jgi:hypothetical protein
LRGGLLKRFKLAGPPSVFWMATGENRELKFSAMAGTCDVQNPSWRFNHSSLGMVEALVD